MNQSNKSSENSKTYQFPQGSKINAPVSVGDGTTINGSIIIKGGKRCIIRKYCALGDGIRIITSDHQINMANLNISLQKIITGKTNHTSKGAVQIGNNVWIGDNAVILSGVTIGNGSVVAAGAVVTKDVPPFTVVAGNPAKIVKERFPQNKQNFLQQLRWWDWTFSRIKANAAFFSCDINTLSIDEIESLIVK